MAGPNERQTAATCVGSRHRRQGPLRQAQTCAFGECKPLRGLLEPLFRVVAYVGAQSIPGHRPGVLNVYG